MVPSPRLLWILALAGFPAALAGGLVSGLEPLALVIVLLVAVAAVGDALWSQRRLASLRIPKPAEPFRLYRDRPGVVAWELHRDDGQPFDGSLRIALAWPESFTAGGTDLEVAAQGLERIAVTSEVTPRRRGRFMISLAAVETRSRLGLWDLRRRLATELEVRVYPNLRQGDALQALKQGALGLSVLRQVGKGREFEKLREYAPGDGFDEIHWKATARRGKPITKVFQVERTQEIYVAIDAGRLSGRPAEPGGEAMLERYIQAALVLGSAAERNGDLFGLVTFRDQVEGFVRARNGKAHYASCREALYRLEPSAASTDFEELASFLRLNLRRRALVVILTGLDDPLLSEGFARAMRLLSPQHVVLAGMIRPEGVEPVFASGEVEKLEDVYAGLAGHTAWRSLQELEKSLRRQGVQFSLLRPETVCQQLVNQYREVKRRQLL